MHFVKTKAILYTPHITHLPAFTVIVLQRVDEILILQIGKIIERIGVVSSNVTFRLVSSLLIGSHAVPLGRRFQGKIDDLTGLSLGSSSSDVSLVEHSQVEGLEDDETGQNTQDGHVCLRSQYPVITVARRA